MIPKEIPCENYNPETFTAEMQQDFDLTDQQAEHVTRLQPAHWAPFSLSNFAPLEGVKYVHDGFLKAVFASENMRDFFVGESTEGFRGVMDFRDGVLGHKIKELQQASDDDSRQRLERIEKRLADLTKATNLSMAQHGMAMMCNTYPIVRLLEVEPATSLVVTDPSSRSAPTIEGEFNRIAVVNSGIADAAIASDRIMHPGTSVTSLHQGKGGLFTSIMSQFVTDVSEQGFHMHQEHGGIAHQLSPHARTKELAYPKIEHAVGDSAAQLAAQSAKHGKFDIVILPQVLDMSYEQCEEVVRATSESLGHNGYFALKMPRGYNVDNKEFDQLIETGREVIGEVVSASHAGLINQDAYRNMPLNMLAQLIIFRC